MFFGAGEQEIADPGLAAWGIVSSQVLMVETLGLRRYPSLKVTGRIFPGKDHMSVIPEVFSEGLQAVWADRARAPLKSGG